MEDIIFNLCKGIDVKATEAKVDAYRKENAGEIARPTNGTKRKTGGSRRKERVVLRRCRWTARTWATRRVPRAVPEGSVACSVTPGHGRRRRRRAAQAMMAVPKPTAMPQSGGKAAHGAWDHGLDQSAEGRAKREAAIAKACGVDMHALGMARARQEALQSIFC